MSNLTTQNKDKLRKAIIEIADSLTRIAAERDLQKEIIKKTSEELTIDKKIIRRMAKVYFNNESLTIRHRQGLTLALRQNA